MRTALPFGAVFWDGEAWLVANDSYTFRYMVDQLLASGLSPFNPFDFRDLPNGIGDHDVSRYVAVMLTSACLI